MSNLHTVILFIFLIQFGIRLCYLLLNLLLLKRKVHSLGKKICSLPDLLSSKRWLYAFIMFVCFFVIPLFLILLILSKDLLFLVSCIFILTEILRIILVKAVSVKNGIYEKGIVVGMFIKYNQIHFYRQLDNSEIMIFMKNGHTLHLKIDESNDEIAKVFEYNQIPLVQN